MDIAELLRPLVDSAPPPPPHERLVERARHRRRVRRVTATAVALIAVVAVIGIATTVRRDGGVTRLDTASQPAPSPTSTPTTSTSMLTTTDVQLQPDEVAAAVAPVIGADPVLVPTAVPSDWSAAVTVGFNAFQVTYTGPSGEKLTLSISMPNPPPPMGDSTQQFGFRGDLRGLYQVQRAGDPTTARYLVWDEPGTWTGDPSIENSARADSVPYYLTSTGVTEALFRQIAGSLTAVPHASAGHPTIAVIPSRHLHDGQTVHVVISGFAAYDRVRLSECAGISLVTELGCGDQLAAQPAADLDAHGFASWQFDVQIKAATRPLETPAPVTCTDQCVLVATANNPDEPPATAPIAFG